LEENGERSVLDLIFLAISYQLSTTNIVDPIYQHLTLVIAL